MFFVGFCGICFDNLRGFWALITVLKVCFELCFRFGRGGVTLFCFALLGVGVYFPVDLARVVCGML